MNVAVRFSKLIIFILMISLAVSCQNFGEFAAPRRDMHVVDLSQAQSSSVYTKISEYLLGYGFEEKQPTQAECEAMQGIASGCYRSFSFTEKSSPFVVNVHTYVGSAHDSVFYQVEEIDPKRISKVPAVFSPEACGVIAGLNRYVSGLMGADHMQENGVSNCVAGSL